VAALRRALESRTDPEARRLSLLADYLVPKSLWIVGGDGWAYDIGFGGLDHVLSLGLNVNILVLDTEVYSNTGGQQSKATPIGAAAKFAVAGKATGKKDLGAMARDYGHVYVAQIAFGAKDAQTVRVLAEAETYPGTSLVIAYSPCIAHGYDLAHGLHQQRLAVESGYWPLYRFDPRRAETGEPAFVLDGAPPTLDLDRFARNETRFRLVEQQNPDRFRALMQQGQAAIRTRFGAFEELARARAGREEKN
jgi:pyruvate-ferredoxin/flavodoxin oxidoreductase